jgi:hypothetical protein
MSGLGERFLLQQVARMSAAICGDQDWFPDVASLIRATLAAIIIGITLAFGAIHLVRKWLIKDKSKPRGVG